MFFGYNTNGFASHRLEDTIKILAELGYKGLGLTADFHTIDPLAEHWRERARRIDRRLRDAGMRVVVETGARFILDTRRKHQPTLLDPDRHKALDRLHFIEACIRLAADLDADCVSFWSGASADDTPAKIKMARLVEACHRLCDFAEGRQVRLAFEPEPGMFIDTMEKFAELHGKVNRRNFGLTLDIGHLQCNGELPIGDYIRQWKDQLWNIHIEDARRGAHEHLLFGEGEIDFVDVMNALRDINYRRGVYVELSRHSHDAVETARKSIEFLKAIPKPTANEAEWWDKLERDTVSEASPGAGDANQTEAAEKGKGEGETEIAPPPLPPGTDHGGEATGGERTSAEPGDDERKDPS